MNASLSGPVVALMKGVVYREGDAVLWQALAELQSQVAGLRRRDRLLGAKYRTKRKATPTSASGREPTTNQESHAWFHAANLDTTSACCWWRCASASPSSTRRSGGDTRLVLARDELVELVRVLPSGFHE